MVNIIITNKSTVLMSFSQSTNSSSLAVLSKQITEHPAYQPVTQASLVADSLFHWQTCVSVVFHSRGRSQEDPPWWSTEDTWQTAAEEIHHTYTPVDNTITITHVYNPVVFFWFHNYPYLFIIMETILLHVFVVIALKIQLFCMENNRSSKEHVFSFTLNMHTT